MFVGESVFVGACCVGGGNVEKSRKEKRSFLLSISSRIFASYSSFNLFVVISIFPRNSRYSLPDSEASAAKVSFRRIFFNDYNNQN